SHGRSGLASAAPSLRRAVCVETPLIANSNYCPTSRGRRCAICYEFGIAVPHPYDDGVWLGDIGALRSLPDSVDAVVPLCRVGDADLPARTEQIDVRLIDRVGENANLHFVLLDTVRLLEQLRREGRIVLIHCVQAQSRTAHSRRALRCAV